MTALHYILTKGYEADGIPNKKLFVIPMVQCLLTTQGV